MQPLATVEQVGMLLRADLPADDPTAALLLGWASDLIRAYTGQTITAVAGDRITLTPANGVLELPERPVTNVTLVESSSRSEPTVWTVLDPAEYVVDYPRGRIRGTGMGSYYGYPSWPYHWPVHQDSFRVTYDHGLTEVPAGISGVAASVAARLYNTPPGIINERNGQRGASYSAENFLTPLELMTLGQYREARIA